MDYTIMSDEEMFNIQEIRLCYQRYKNGYIDETRFLNDVLNMTTTDVVCAYVTSLFEYTDLYSILPADFYNKYKDFCLDKLTISRGHEAYLSYDETLLNRCLKEFEKHNIFESKLCSEV